MKFILFVLIIGLPCYAGDLPTTSFSTQADKTMEEFKTKMEAARKLPVPLPEKTRFDKDLKARSVYLEEYAEGYRTILAALDVGCHMGVRGPYFKPYVEGWSDGREQARKDHPEKIYEMYGIAYPKPQPE